MAFEHMPLQSYGLISETFLQGSLLQTLTLGKKMRLTIKMTCFTLAFLQILLARRLIRSYLTQLLLRC